MADAARAPRAPGAERATPADEPPSKPHRGLKARAIGYLARREYGRAELRARLLGCAGGDRDKAAEVDALIDELVALGLLSDERYAQSVVARKAGSYSRRAIAETLKAQGVPREAAATALAETTVEDDEAMVALWRRRFGRPPYDERDKARQVRFLQSRGFGLAAILALLRHPPVPVDE